MDTPEPKVTHVRFTNRGAISGDPIGPMRLMFADDEPGSVTQDEWVKRSEAAAIATAAGVPLEEV